MPHIFISYKRQDRPWVEALATAIEATGRSVWWDDRLAAGEQYDEVLETKLEEAGCVIVLWSKASVESRWVRTEANEGLRRNILVPVCIEEVEPPLAFRLIHTGTLVGWNRSPDHPLFLDLLQDIARLVEPSEKTGNGGRDRSNEGARTGTGQRGAARSSDDPPDAVRDGSVPSREALPETFTDERGIQFALIQPGSFMMGSEEGSHHERPVHPVEITRPFYLGIYPVTQGQYQAVLGATPSTFKGADHPVERVSWKDTQRFISVLNATGGAYRLPTEAEWEYACRAGSVLPYSFGHDVSRLADHAWYAENAGGQTHPVGEKEPNAWGLFDMHGNVWEWVGDWHAGYTEAAAVDPVGPEQGSHRVVRGGSWNDPASALRSSNRYNYGPTARFHVVGFRLVRMID